MDQIFHIIGKIRWWHGANPRRKYGVSILVLFGFILFLGPGSETGSVPHAVRQPTPVPKLPPLSAYQTIDVRELKKKPDASKGKSLKLEGEVFRISEKGGKADLQMHVRIPGGSDFDTEAVYVTSLRTLPGVYEKTKIVVYGTGAGTMSGTNAFGGVMEQPLIEADTITH